MNKVYSILWILILFIISTVTSQIYCGSRTATKADDCKDDTLTQSYKDADYVHCCYVQREKYSAGNTCEALTSKQYKNIGKYIKYYEEDSKYAYEIKIDCQSSNLHLFLFALIIQLILF